jgi:sulfite reductase (NADPH) flavoprotein alpha-component
MLDLIPETAPFSPGQRLWLNGFFAGLLSVEAEVSAAGLNGAASAATAGAAPPAEEAAPWHDAAVPLEERMKLAEGKPLPRRLFAAMAQQDCGQCGYLCETYSKAIADRTETKLNLCVPGGKETSRTLRALLDGVRPTVVFHRVRGLHLGRRHPTAARATRRSMPSSAWPRASTASARRRTRGMLCSTSPAAA